MKNVLFVATVSRHINAFHIPFLKLFKENGYNVEVASNGEETIKYCDKHYNLPFERFPFSIANVKAYTQLKKIINSNKYDIIHCHTPVGGMITRLAARRTRKKNNTKVIYTAHGFHFYKGAPILNWLIYYPLEKLMSRYTDCLITINNEDFEIAKRKFKAKQIELVHGVGIDTEKFKINWEKKQISEKRQELGIGEDNFLIIQVGELNKNKNQIMLIDTMQKLVNRYSNITAILVGSGKLEEYLKNKIKEYNLEKNIFVLGQRKDIPELLAISDCLVSLSYREGLPVNVMEAVGAGKYVIGTDIRGNRDIINSSNGILIQLNNKEELEKAIVNLYKKKIIPINISLNEEFTKNEIKNKLKTIYNLKE